MKNLAKNREVQQILFQLTFGGFIAILIWVSMSVYSAWVKETENKIDKKMLKPITTNFDVDTLNKLKNRQVLPTNIQLNFEEASQTGRQE